MSQLPFLLIVLPMTISFVLPLSDLITPHLRKAVLSIYLIVQAVMCGVLLANWDRLPLQYVVGGWRPDVGIALYVDELSAVFILLVVVLGAMSTVYSFDRITHNQGKYYVLLLLLVAGLVGAFSTGDLFNLYVFSEIVAITSYALVAFERRVSALEAAFKYLLYGALSGVFFLLAVTLTYYGTGSLNMAVIASRVQHLDPIVLTAVTGFLLLTFSVKMGLVPFHTWLSDAHAASPSPVSAMLSGAVINLGFYSMVRVFHFIFGPELSGSLWVYQVLLVLGVASVLLGHLLAAAQGESKRLLAYSSIAQMGYVAMALGLGTPTAVVVAVIYAVVHGLLKSGLFLSVGSLTHDAGSREIAALSGAFYRWRNMSVSLAVLIMGIIGVPPLAGFASKAVLIRGLIVNGPVVTLVVVIVGTLASAYYYLRFAAVLFQPFTEESEICPVEFVAESKLGLATHLPVYFLIAAVILVGLIPAFAGVKVETLTAYVLP